jgi:hypothetical protein
MQQALGQQPKGGEEDEDEEEEEEEDSDEETETETESSSEEENTEALQERRMLRELKLLSTKLKSFKEKEEAARKERRSLRDQLKKQQKVCTIVSMFVINCNIRIMNTGLEYKTPTWFLKLKRYTE